MKELFITILNMSVTATIAAIIVIFIKIILIKAPKIFSYSLWAVVLFRLLIPFSLEAPFSLFSLMPDSTQSITDNLAYSYNLISKSEEINKSDLSNIAENIYNENINAYTNSTGQLENSLNNSNQQGEKSINLLIEVASIIWIIGVSALISYSIITYVKLYSKLSTSTLIRDNIFETDQIKNPFVIGLFKPRIIIPINLTEKELDCILMHEHIHIKRKDNIIKPLAFFALIIHWFNPVIWLSYYLMVKDMEMSCDEGVMNKAAEDIRCNYSNTLLSLSMNNSSLLAPLAFGESNVKSRIKNILNYKKPSFWIVIALIALLITITILIGTNPRQEKYEFSGTVSEQIGDSYFLSEDSPKNIFEQIVHRHFLNMYQQPYDIEHLTKKGMESVIINNENEKSDIYTSYVLHNISVVDKHSQNFDSIIKKHNLFDYEVISVIYTQNHSTNKLLLGPQWGDGTYSQMFIVGKQAKDKEYKIYEYMLPNQITDQEEINSVIYKNSIQLYTYENYEIVSERTITDPISKLNINTLLKSGNTSSRKATSDLPPTGHYIKVVLNGREESFKESGTHYVYEINSRYYVEIPYEHIADITHDAYRGIVNYNRLGTLPNPVFISTVISKITKEEYKETGNDNSENINLNDFRKINFKLYVEFPEKIKERKIEIPNLYMIKKSDEESRLRGGSSFEQDNESENFAIYEQELILDVRELNDNDIIEILKPKEAAVYWVDNNNKKIEFKYSIGDIVEIEDGLN